MKITKCNCGNAANPNFGYLCTACATNKCAVCLKALDNPYRRVVDGSIVEGCVDACHGGHLLLNSASDKWHFRPQARQYREDKAAVLGATSIDNTNKPKVGSSEWKADLAKASKENAERVKRIISEFLQPTNVKQVAKYRRKLTQWEREENDRKKSVRVAAGGKVSRAKAEIDAEEERLFGRVSKW